MHFASYLDTLLNPVIVSIDLLCNYLGCALYVFMNGWLVLAETLRLITVVTLRYDDSGDMLPKVYQTWLVLYNIHVHCRGLVHEVDASWRVGRGDGHSQEEDEVLAVWVRGCQKLLPRDVTIPCTYISNPFIHRPQAIRQNMEIVIKPFAMLASARLELRRTTLERMGWRYLDPCW